MKTKILTLLALIAIIPLFAQLDTPQPSPKATLTQTVGLTDITIEYSRPSLRGREVFDNIVPYNKLWRTGANANTKITFTHDINIDGNELKAGTYALFTKPNKKNWDVYFYNDYSNWGTPKKFDNQLVALHTNVAVQSLKNTVESFTIAINDLTNDSANLQLMWDQVMVSVPFTVPTQATTLANIDQLMAGPNANDYYKAASYYLEINKDLDLAHKWITKAVDLNPDAFWVLRKKSLIEAQKGDKKAAIKSAQQSLKLADKAGNQNYVNMNKESLKQWGASMD